MQEPTVSQSGEQAQSTNSLDGPLPGISTETSKPLPGSAQSFASRYLIGEEIARGGMGVVYRATDHTFNREVAIKVLSDRYAPDSPAYQRFREEARITGQLQHPAIPPVHDYGTLPDGRPFLAMKLIQGNTLDVLLKSRENPRDDQGRFIAIFEQICQAVGFAHAHNVIHRDLKPMNVMVGAFGEVQLMDWGLAKILDEGRKSESGETELIPAEVQSGRADPAEFTQAGSILGTPAYMPPEQALGAIQLVDKRADVFGLGSILAVILTGQPPYVGETSEFTRQLAAKAKLENCFARLAECGAHPKLIQLCKACLSPRRTNRPADAEKVAVAVADLRAQTEEQLRQAALDRLKAEVQARAEALKAEEELKRQELQAEEERKRLELQAEEKLKRQKLKDEEARKRETLKGILITFGLMLGCLVIGGWIMYQYAQKTENTRNELQSRLEALEAGTEVFEREKTLQSELTKIQQIRQKLETRLQFLEEERSVRLERERIQQSNLNKSHARMHLLEKLLFEQFGPEVQKSITIESRGQIQTPTKINPEDYRLNQRTDLDRVIRFRIDQLSQTITRKSSENKLISKLPFHFGEINSAAFSPDGTRIVTVSRDQTAKVWEVRTGKYLLTLQGHGGSVTSAAFSPDGTQIVTASGDKTAKVWETGTEKLLLTLEGHGDWVRSATFSPDGTRIVTASDDQTAKVWETGTGKLLQTLQGHGSTVNSASFSPDGTRIVTASDDETAKVWEAGTGKLLLTLEGHGNRVWSAVFSPDGTRIVTASRDGIAKVWEAGTGKLLHTLQGHSSTVNSASFSPDGTRIVNVSADIVKVWEAGTGKLIHSIQGHGKSVNSAAFSPDGTRIVTVSDGYTAEVIEARTGKLLHTLKDNGYGVQSAEFSQEGAWIIISKWEWDAKIWSAEVWDASSGKHLHSLGGHSAKVLSVTLSPDGKKIFTINHLELMIWNTQDGKLERRIDLKTVTPIVHMSYSRDGQWLLTIHKDESARIWNSQTGELLLAY